MRTIIIWVLLLFTSVGFAQEVCNNGIDDDGDGLIDINDPDCNCNNLQIVSLIPNSSFETFTSCAQHEIPLPGWVEANQLSPDYYNPACSTSDTNVPQPYPDGDGVVGQIVQDGGSEFIGTCLNGPLRAGTSYQLTFNITADIGMNACIYGLDPIDITLYGAANCADMPLPMYAVPNSNTPFVILGAANYTPKVAWGELTIVFTPTFDTNALIIGGAEFLSSTYDISINQCRPYFVYDDLILNEARYFGVSISTSGNYCQDTMVLTANPAIPVSGTTTYQWYREGIAIAGATVPTYNISSNGSDTGNYQVMISDGATCATSTVYTVSNITGAPQFTIIAPTCSTNGNITVTTTADEYSFDGGLTWSTNSFKGNLLPDVYSVKVRYASGCVSGAAAVNLPVPIYGPAPAYRVTNATCGPTGSITVTTPASQYSFDNGLTWVTSTTLSNIPAGTYNVKIKDATGCVSYASPVFVDQNYLADPLYAVVQPYCTSNGSITITTPSDEYSFDGGLTWQVSNTISGITAGTYTLMIRDGLQCVSHKVIITLTAVTGYPTYVMVPPGCGGAGSITITNAGGTQYSFDNGSTWQASDTLGNLSAGSYTILYKDGNGCISNPLLVTLFSSPWSIYPTFNMVPVSCDLGSITITTPAAAYSFNAGATWQLTPTLSGLAAGNYGLAVKNAQGCISFTKYVQLTTVPGTLADPQFTAADADCILGMGSISITTVADRYSFDNGLTWQTSGFSGPLSPGAYQIKIKSTLGCESNALAFSILPAAPVAPPVVQNVDLCQNSVASALTANSNNLLWYTALTGGTGNTNAPVPATTIATTTSYYVSQVINGCESARATIIVTVVPTPQPPVAPPPVTYCQGQPTQPLSAAGSNLLWYTTATGGTGSAVAPSPSGSGTVTYYVSKTVNGCESARVPVNAIIKPVPATPGVVSPVTYLQDAVAVPLIATGNNLNWYDSDLDPLAGVPVPSTRIVGTQVFYVSQTLNGCEGPLQEIRVNILTDQIVIDYPLYLTPNGDGYNETWNVSPIRGQKVNTFIFDRYGKLLTQVFSPGTGWDGTYNGQNMPATDYWFVLKYKDNGVEKEFKAHFSLLR